jgi:hypothetical protein
MATGKPVGMASSRRRCHRGSPAGSAGVQTTRLLATRFPFTAQVHSTHAPHAPVQPVMFRSRRLDAPSVHRRPGVSSLDLTGAVLAAMRLDEEGWPLGP